MYPIDAYETENQSYSCDDGNSGGACPLPTNSTTAALKLLGKTMDLIGCWIKALEHNSLERCHLYTCCMKELYFRKYQLNFLINPVQKIRKSLLHTIGVGWYVDRLGQKIPPLNKS